MNTIYIILSVILLFWVLLKYHKKRKNELLSLELQSIYDKVEIDFISNGVNNLTNDEIEFLKAYKRIAYNSYLLDIRLIIIAFKEQQKDKSYKSKNKNIDIIMSNQSSEFKGLLNEFHRVSFKKVKLSCLNSGFLWIIFVLFFKTIVTCNVNIIKKKFSLRAITQVLNPTGVGYVAPQTC